MFFSNPNTLPPIYIWIQSHHADPERMDAAGISYANQTLSMEEQRAVVMMMGLGDILADGDAPSCTQPSSGPSRGSGGPSTSSVVPCNYSGGTCAGLTEDELSRGVPGVRQHLWQHHRNHFAHDRHGKNICQWRTGTREVCAMAISDLDNLARHMASVHLKLTTQKCPRCGSQFSRMDALLRHCKRCG